MYAVATGTQHASCSRRGEESLFGLFSLLITPVQISVLQFKQQKQCIALTQHLSSQRTPVAHSQQHNLSKETTLKSYKGVRDFPVVLCQLSTGGKKPSHNTLLLLAHWGWVHSWLLADGFVSPCPDQHRKQGARHQALSEHWSPCFCSVSWETVEIYCKNDTSPKLNFLIIILWNSPLFAFYSLAQFCLPLCTPSAPPGLTKIQAGAEKAFASLHRRSSFPPLSSLALNTRTFL